MLMRSVWFAAMMFAATPAAADMARVNVRGYDEFCAEEPGLCRSGPAKSIYYTPAIADLMGIVQREVNNAILYTPDVTDEFTVYPQTGDCEDYAVSKMVSLMKQGIPREALRLAFVQVPVVVQSMRGDPMTKWYNHMVLVVNTTAGAFYLDNRADTVRKVATSKYRWFAMELARDGRTWFYAPRSTEIAWEAP